MNCNIYRIFSTAFLTVDISKRSFIGLNSKLLTLPASSVLLSVHAKHIFRPAIRLNKTDSESPYACHFGKFSTIDIQLIYIKTFSFLIPVEGTKKYVSVLRIKMYRCKNSNSQYSYQFEFHKVK